MRALLAILLTAVAVGPAVRAVSEPTAAPLTERLIGSWRLVSYDRQSGTGEATPVFGPAPRGRLIYDAAGRMSVHLADPRRAAFASNDFLRGTPEEVRQAFEGYFGYFGSYSVDVAAGTVTHHVEGASFPNYAGTDQKRFFTLSGDRLSLGTPPTVRGGARFTYLVAWERER
jgi:hypothetical protein